MKRIFTLLFLFIAGGAFSQTLTEVMVPQYIQGLNATNANRIPYAYKVTLSGLTPSMTYRYFNSVVTTAEAATSNGAGNIIYPHDTAFSMGAQNLATAGAFNEFTTDAAGSYTGWFITEPTGNATRFTPGTLLQLRIILNDGMGGTVATTRLTTTSTVTVINFGTTAADGSAIRSTPGTATPKNFVMLYDNEAGTGRPISGIYVESDGLAAGASYAAFYKADVDAKDATWGTIIPNTLANGIRRIAQYSLATGNLVGSSTSATGEWPSGTGEGTVSTTNPRNGTSTVIVLNGAAVLLPVQLQSFNAFLTDKSVKINWISANETNVRDFTIERSIDGRTYFAIGKVNTLNRNGASYSFTDASPAEGINYYRLKITDKNGSLKYSAIASINTRGGIKASLFPNPAVDNLTVIHSKATGNATIKVVNVQGQQLKLIKIESGATQTSVSVNELTKGNYVLIYQNGEERSVTKFVK